jgi:hypothetical protein
MRLSNWELVGQMGDVDYITYGGTLVYRDADNEYTPEAETVVPMLKIIPTKEENDQWTVYRYPLEKCTLVNGVLSDNKYHPEHPAWFADILESVAETCDTDADDLREAFCSDDIMRRAWAYDTVANYSGYHEFDSYPIMFFSLEDVEKRYE